MNKLLQKNILPLAFLCSGIASLGFQMLWSKLLKLILGNETTAAVGIIVSFFVGFGIGSYFGVNAIRKSKRPIIWFAIAEFVIALFGLLSLIIFPYLSETLPIVFSQLISETHSSQYLLLSIFSCTLILSIPTIAMGITFPIIVEAYKRQTQQSKSVGLLYSINTFGAVLGVAISSYLLFPKFGFVIGTLSLCGFSCLAIILSYYWTKQHNTLDETKTKIGSDKVYASKYTLLFVTGFASIGLEILIVYFLSQVLSNTVYTFANLLIVYLIGNAFGGWLYKKLNIVFTQKTTMYLLLLLATGCLIVGYILSNFESFQINNHYFRSTSYKQAIWQEIYIGSILFLIPSILMGFLFSHLLDGLPKQVFQKAYALNSIGAAFAAIVIGVYAIPILGGRNSLYAIAILYLISAIFWMLFKTKETLPFKLIYTSVSIAILVFFPKNVQLIVNENHLSIAFQKESNYGVVSVLSNKKAYQVKKHTLLKVNNRFKMGGGSSFVDKRIGHMALLLHPSPKKVAYLGVGTAITMSPSKFYDLQEIDAVELIPEIRKTYPYFDNDSIYNQSNINFISADARRFIAGSKKKYDVILADMYHPGKDGAAFLYSQQHFTNISKRLSKDGMFVQLIPLHQFDVKNLKTVIKTFTSCFKDAHAFLGSYNVDLNALILFGSNNEIKIDYDDIQSRLYRTQLIYYDTEDLLSSYLFDKQGLDAFAKGAELNSDLFPRLLYEMPKFFYENKDDKKSTTILKLLKQRSIKPLIAGNKKHSKSIKKRTKAVDYYLAAEYMLKKKNFIASPKIVDVYLKSYDTDSNFNATKGRLFYFLENIPEAKALILPKLAEKDIARYQERLLLKPFY